MIPLTRKAIAKATRKMIISGRADDALKSLANQEGVPFEELKKHLVNVSEEEIESIIEKFIGSFGGTFDWK